MACGFEFLVVLMFALEAATRWGLVDDSFVFRVMDYLLGGPRWSSITLSLSEG